MNTDTDKNGFCIKRMILCACVILSTLQVVSLERSIGKYIQRIEGALSHSRRQVEKLDSTASLFETLSKSLSETKSALSAMQDGLNETTGSLHSMNTATTQIHHHISSITRSTEKISASVVTLDGIMLDYKALSDALQKESLSVVEQIKQLEALSVSMDGEFKGLVEQMKRPGIQKLLSGLKKQESK